MQIFGSETGQTREHRFSSITSRVLLYLKLVAGHLGRYSNNFAWWYTFLMSQEWPKGATEPVIQDFKKSEITSSRIHTTTLDRPKISEVEREQTEKELKKLGELMGDSDVWWQLDGTLTASLREIKHGGDYIGAHSDIDISVLRSELPKLEQYLKEKGYGLFLISRNGDQRTFRRVGYKVFSSRSLNGVREAPYIAAMDEQGNIRIDADLVRVQVAIVDIDTDSNPSERGVNYPKSWLEGETVTVNGVPIILSHPARHLFFKIWQTRGYDEKDIDLIAEMNLLTNKDLDTLENIVLSKAADPAWWEENKHYVKDDSVLRSRLAKLRKHLTEKN